MQCTVYKSMKKPDWYLFAPQGVDVATLSGEVVARSS